MPPLPSLFLDRLKDIFPETHFDPAVRSFERASVLSVRINTLKAHREEVLGILKEQKINWQAVSWFKDALILENISLRQLSDTRLIKEGLLYVQGLSSMLPVMVLDPRPGERVLDFCAAPGSKTTQMAALMDNRGHILAIEAIRNRFYRLKSVVSHLGARIVDFKVTDARRVRLGELFDKVLVDVPCSSEGRFKTFHKKTYAYWSPRKIKEMVRKQRGLLLSAGRLLKPGGVLVYSTCTFAPEENEGVVDWLLQRKDNALRVEPFGFPGIRTYPVLSQWGKKKYHPQVSECRRILPDEKMEGFFMAKLRHGSWVK